MASPKLKDLPQPPKGKVGWPWTEESTSSHPLPPSCKEWPRITAITPSFNQAQFLEATIRSVLLQGYPNLEYMVFDGGSSDGSAEILKKYSAWIDYWRSEPDGGQSDAVNRGLHQGTGDYAAWVNSDDILCKDALKAQMSQILSLGPVSADSQDVFVGICHYIDANGTITHTHQGRVRTFEELLRLEDIWRTGGHIVQPEVLFPRPMALRLGALDAEDHRTMDYDLWAKFLLAGSRFHYTDVPFAMFRVHQAQKTTERIATTAALVGTAIRLLESSPLAAQQKVEIRNELAAYMKSFESQHWKATGRLAGLGLPKSTVTRLRSLLKKF